MQQQLGFYETTQEIEDAAKEMASNGWFIHTVSDFNINNRHNFYMFVVVYRKKS